VRQRLFYQPDETIGERQRNDAALDLKDKPIGFVVFL
jgi:hypothetical protein